MQHVHLSFYQKQKKSSKDVTINCRLTIGGRRIDMSTGVKINPQLFDTSRNMVIGRSSQAVQVNARLEKFKTKINSIIISYEHEGKMPKKKGGRSTGGGARSKGNMNKGSCCSSGGVSYQGES